MSRFFLFCSFLHTSVRMGKPAGRVDHRPEILEEGVEDKCCHLHLARKNMHVPRRVKVNMNRPRPRALAENHCDGVLLGVHKVLSPAQPGTLGIPSIS